MNEIEDRLNAAVRAEAGFGADDVGALVASRRRRRRVATGVAAVLVVVGVGVGIAALGGDDEPDLDVAGEDDGADDGGPGDGGDGDGGPVIDDSAPVDQVLEDPVGADGTTGATATDHLVAESPFQRCDDVPRDGPAEGERYAAQTAMWEAFSEQFSSTDWPFVSGFGSPESIWGMPTVDLTRPDQETFDRLLEFFDPDEMCVGLPGGGEVPPVPVDVAWDLVSVGDDDTAVTIVESTDCATKASHIETWVVDRADRVEVGIQAWSEANSAFTDDCPPPAEYTVKLPAPLAGRDLVVATDRPLEVDAPVVAGATATFAIAEHNRAGIDLVGDDLLARLVDDPAVRFQVSDVFAAPIAGRPRAVARDQHPLTGTGTIRVPADVPAGTYTIQFLDHPELNGIVDVVAGGGGADDGGTDGNGDDEVATRPEPEYGWRVGDLDGDGLGEVVDGANGQVFVGYADGVAPLEDVDGELVSVPLDGVTWFFCRSDGALGLQSWDDDGGGAVRLSRLVIEDGVGRWQAEPSYFGVPEPEPRDGDGCERYGDDPGGDDGGATTPAGVLVADGVESDVHVEAVDLPFPECTEEQFFGGGATDARLVEHRDALLAEGLTDQPFLSTTAVSEVIQFGLNRRYGPTIEWIAERVDPADVCLHFYPPVGAFTAPAPRLDWVVAASAPDSTEVTIRLDRDCGLLGSAPLEPVVQQESDRVVVHWAASAFAGPTDLPCLPPDEATFSLAAPLGDRPVVAAADPAPVDVAAGDVVRVAVGDLASATTDGLGDDVMIQSVDDPSRQIQVRGVWGQPTAGDPAPIITDRYEPTDDAALRVPADTPPGEYSWAFIEHPQLHGTLTVSPGPAS